MAPDLSRAERRRKLLEGAGSLLKLTPALPHRQPLPDLPSTSRRALGIDAARAASALRTAVERERQIAR